MDPFEAFYGRCRYPISWFKVDKIRLFGSDLVHHSIKKVKVI